MFDIADAVTDYVRSLSLVLSFLLLVCWDRSTWLKADALAAAGFGAAFLIFPRAMLEFMVSGKLESLHLQLVMLFGVSMMCSGMMWWFTKDTRDGTVPITLMMSRVFTCGLLLLAMCYTQWLSSRGKKAISWTDQHVWFGMVGAGLWLLGHLYHLLWSTDFSSYPQFNIRINTHLHMDAWMVLTASLLFFAFPDFVLSYLFDVTKRDAVVVHLTRTIGAMSLGSAIISLQAPGFLHEHDKKKQFLSRLITTACGFVTLLAMCLWVQNIVLSQLLNVLLGTTPIIANAVIGYYAGGSLFYKFSQKDKLKTN